MNKYTAKGRASTLRRNIERRAKLAKKNPWAKSIIYPKLVDYIEKGSY